MQEDLVCRALRGEQRALTELVAYATPIIRARVARACRKRLQNAHFPEELVCDLTQEVLEKLFSSSGGALLDWRPSRGLSLGNFIGLIAARHAGAVLRRKYSQWRVDPLDERTLDAVADAAGTEEQVLEKERLAKLFEGLRQMLSPLGLELFERLYCEEQGVAEIQHACGLSADAVYQWKLRLRRLVTAVLLELEGSARLPRKPGPPLRPRRHAAATASSTTPMLPRLAGLCG